MRIEALTRTGLGRADDGSLVPRVLPGERIEISDDGTPRILEPSAERVAPPCRHFRACGGCAMQHARDDVVADWKAGILRTALRAQGIEADIARVETSPPQSRRRAKLTGRRTKKGALVGFHAARSDDVVAAPECQILRPGLRALFPALEAITRLAATRTTDAELHVTETEAGADLVVISPRSLDRDLRETLPALARAHGIVRITWNSEPVATLEPPFLWLSGIRVVPPPGAFLQATAEGEAALVAEVTRITKGARRVVDLFAGCGTFGLPLARDAQVHAVEGDHSLLEAMDQAWRGADGLKSLTVETRDLFRRPMLPDELASFDAVVIDPPRAGAEAQVTELARGGGPGVIAMVSCNPVTFARDARTLLDGGFGMGDLAVVDQFRWSAHLEMVCGFTRS